MAEPIKLDAATSAPPIKPAGTQPTDAPALNQNQSIGNIFTRTAEKKEEAKILTTVLTQQELLNKPKSVLGAVPTLEKTIEIEKEQRSKRKLRFVKLLLVLVFLCGFATSAYFYLELSPDFSAFGANTTQRLENLNNNLQQLQTDVNKYRYLITQLKLNEFSYLADTFLRTSTDANTGSASSDTEEIKNTLPSILKEIRENLTQDVFVKTETVTGKITQTDDELKRDAEMKLREALLAERKNFNKENQTPEDVANIKLIDNAIKLVGNKPLFVILRKISTKDFSKDISDYFDHPDPKKLKNLQTLINSILVSTKSDISTIAEIKKNMVAWSEVIKKIADETRNLPDTHFGNSSAYEALGGIVYTGYDFQKTTGKIMLSGNSKTTDGTNFTLLSNLIHQLESSPDFEDVEMRTFSKSKGISNISGESYTASFKIDLSLQKRPVSEKDRLILTPKEEAAGESKKTTGAIPGLAPLLEKVTELQTQIKFPFLSGENVDSKAPAGQTQTQAQPQTQTQFGTQSQTQARAITELQLQTQSVRAKTSTQIQTQAQPQLQPQTQTQTRAKAPGKSSKTSP